jgi:hypothetical protein
LQKALVFISSSPSAKQRSESSSHLHANGMQISRGPYLLFFIIRLIVNARVFQKRIHRHFVDVTEDTLGAPSGHYLGAANQELRGPRPARPPVSLPHIRFTLWFPSRPIWLPMGGPSFGNKAFNEVRLVPPIGPLSLIWLALNFLRGPAMRLIYPEL